jgi:hypothetical protein
MMGQTIVGLAVSHSTWHELLDQGSSWTRPVRVLYRFCIAQPDLRQKGVEIN